MTIAEGIPAAVTLVESLSEICLIIAMIGCLFTLLTCACVLRFPRDGGAEPAAQSPVTILKPLHGREPGLPGRLAAFCRQDYGAPVQILCGAQHRDTPVAEVMRALGVETPDWTVELLVEPRSHGANRKISNLINIVPRARHDTLVLSDSDIVVGPDYLRAVTALLASPRVGAVTCLYHGIGAAGSWSDLAALAINAQFLPLAITAVSLGLAKPCFGATIALRRSTLNRIGGLGALADVLADDYALGLAVRAAGYQVAMAPLVVGHLCFENSLRELVLHQLRAARTIKSIDPVGYAGTIITHPWPLALIALLSGSPAAVLVAFATVLARLTLCRCVEWRFELPRQNYWLVPLHDLIAFGVYVASFFGVTVHWCGADYRVAADGTFAEGQDLRRS
jgi:ceramide glucosyltransferase